MTRPTIIEKTKSFYDDMKITNKCILWGMAAKQKKKNLQEILSVKLLLDNLEYSIFWHLSSTISARLKEFYCSYILTLADPQAITAYIKFMLNFYSTNHILWPLYTSATSHTKFLIIWHLSSPLSARLQEFLYSYILILSDVHNSIH